MNVGDAVAEIGRTVPFLGPLVLLFVVAMALEAVVLVRARRRLALDRELRRRALAGDGALAGVLVPSRLPEVLAALAPLPAIAVAVASIQHARGLFAQGMRLPAEGVHLLVHGMTGQFNGFPLSILLLALTLVLACFAVGSAVAARLQAQRLRLASALEPVQARSTLEEPELSADLLTGALAAFVVLGLGPILATAFRFDLHLASGFREMAGVDAETKLVLFDQLLAEGRTELARGLLLGRIGVALALAISVGLVVVRRRRPSVAAPRRHDLWLAGLFAAGAVAAWLAARPFQRENETPWPPRGNGGPHVSAMGPSLRLEGPDQPAPAPVIYVTAEGIRLNGGRSDPHTLAEALPALRSNFELLHSDQRFNHLAAIVCSPDAPLPTEVLSAALLATYNRPEFLFLRDERIVRPMFGPLVRSQGTAARFAIIDHVEDADEGASLIKAAEHHTCADLAAHVVRLRRAGKDVAVLVAP